MTDWTWLREDVILAVHDAQLAEHGGGVGLRDAGLLNSALARPINLAAYGDPDIAALAACYAYGLASNHPFVDGNKRTAYVAMELFMAINGYALTADDADCVQTMLHVAAGELPEDDLAAWVRTHMVPDEED